VQDGDPEPPQSGVEGDPITISDGSGGNGTSRDAHLIDGRPGLPGFAPSRSRRRKKRRSMSRRCGGSCRSRTADKSRRSLRSNSSSSRGAKKKDR